MVIDDTDPPPPTRWEKTVTGDRWDFYVNRFAREFADGTDLEGEARFADVLAPRRARILDAGCGTGRIAGALHRMGHRSSARTGMPGWSASLSTATRDRFSWPPICSP